MGKHRLGREKKTIMIMIDMYCKGNHKENDLLCSECRQLLDYALKRIDKCHFGLKKPVCAKCTVHCYKPEMRNRVRKVMRYSGPRMILYHPVLALMHIADKFNRKN